MAWFYTAECVSHAVCGALDLNGGGTTGGAWFITAMKIVAVGIVTQAVLGM